MAVPCKEIITRRRGDDEEGGEKMKTDVQNKSKTNCLALSRNYLVFLEGL